MSIVNGLHEFMNDDAEFAAASAAYGVTIHDVRRPRDKTELRMFTGRIDEVTCPRIAVLGTDSAIGKRTTATILTQALNARGIRAVMVGTGQTGLIQGARYGVALDAIPCQFCSGEMEAAVLDAFDAEQPEVIIIEGQGALSHPAYLSSTFILRGSKPDAVILQHAPARKKLGDFADVPMPNPADEIHLIETFADTKVIGLTINHENMTDAEVTAAITMYEAELGLPTTDALTRSTDRLVDMVVRTFPQLDKKPVFSVAMTHRGWRSASTTSRTTPARWSTGWRTRASPSRRSPRPRSARPRSRASCSTLVSARSASHASRTSRRSGEPASRRRSPSSAPR